MWLSGPNNLIDWFTCWVKTNPSFKVKIDLETRFKKIDLKINDFKLKGCSNYIRQESKSH